MFEYRKKPVVVEAFQMTRERRVDNSEWPQWMHFAWNFDRSEVGALYPTEAGTGDGTLSIRTLEGEHLVSWDDYIIRGVKGEIYPCKPDIFHATYDRVDDSNDSIHINTRDENGVVQPLRAEAAIAIKDASDKLKQAHLLDATLETCRSLLSGYLEMLPMLAEMAEALGKNENAMRANQLIGKVQSAIQMITTIIDRRKASAAQSAAQIGQT